MTRETSRESYKLLLESGKLPDAQGTILSAIVAKPNSTSGEICHELKLENVNAWRARFTELQARGLIVESGTRKCLVSGRTTLTWVYSGRTKPLVPKRRATRGQLAALLKKALPSINGTLAEEIRAALA
jgi:hypothetical protein